MFRTLDINELPSTQGFDDHAYDLVLAANVLHTTPDLVATLKNVRRLLKPGGYLREIVKSLDLNNNIITLHCDGGKYYALEEDSPKLEPSAGSRRIQVDASILSALTIYSNTFFFSLGTDLDSGEHALAVATKNASAIRVPTQWSVPVETRRNIDAQYLSFLSGYLMSKQIASVIPMGRRCLMYEADPGLASLLSRELSE
ncbi:hypothetical protein MBLNU230_g0661t1 [Neophaeotheca triangularis]